jgi:hypothetical protein
MSHDFDRLVSLFESTHGVLQARAARSVDVALVARNWLFGCYLVEFENAGAGRAEIYGKALIDRLAAALSQRGLKGISSTNLRKFRAFLPGLPRDPTDAVRRIRPAARPGQDPTDTVC